MGFIYKITCLITGKPYIGLTTRQVEDRWKEHLYSGKRRIIALQNMEEIIGNSKLYAAMAAHDIENFVIEVIEEVANNDDLDDREIYWINYYDSVNSGYNILCGGRGFKMTDEKYDQMIRAMKLRMTQDIEMRRKYKQELEGLPIHCIYHIKDDVPCITVRDHPYCKFKHFSVTRYGSLDKTKEAVLNFIDEIETMQIPYDPDGIYNGAHDKGAHAAISKGVKAYIANNIDKKRHKNSTTLDGLPVCCQSVKDRGRPAIKVVDHPYCDIRSFNIAKYGGLENTKKLVLEFLADLEAKKEKYVPAIKNKKPPKGISKARNKGWRARSSAPGDKLEKWFADKDTSRENFNDALASLNQFRRKHNLEEIIFDYNDIEDDEE